MKHTIRYISLLPAAVAAGMLAAPATPAFAEPERSQVYAPVYSPEIPAKTSICGQTIDLDKTEYY